MHNNTHHIMWTMGILEHVIKCRNGSGFPFMGAMEARASRSQSTACEVRLPRRVVAKATRVVAEAAEARYKQGNQLVGPFIFNESARELWIVRPRFRVE